MMYNSGCGNEGKAKAQVDEKGSEVDYKIDQIVYEIGNDCK